MVEKAAQHREGVGRLELQWQLRGGASSHIGRDRAQAVQMLDAVGACGACDAQVRLMHHMGGRNGN